MKIMENRPIICPACVLARFYCLSGTFEARCENLDNKS